MAKNCSKTHRLLLGSGNRKRAQLAERNKTHNRSLPSSWERSVPILFLFHHWRHKAQTPYLQQIDQWASLKEQLSRNKTKGAELGSKHANLILYLAYFYATRVNASEFKTALCRIMVLIHLLSKNVCSVFVVFRTVLFPAAHKKVRRSMR